MCVGGGGDKTQYGMCIFFNFDFESVCVRVFLLLKRGENIP